MLFWESNPPTPQVSQMGMLLNIKWKYLKTSINQHCNNKKNVGILYMNCIQYIYIYIYIYIYVYIFVFNMVIVHMINLWFIIDNFIYCIQLKIDIFLFFFWINECKIYSIKIIFTCCFIHKQLILWK